MLPGVAGAQTHPGSSLYLTNGMIINPAYAGSRGTLSTLFSIRKMWSQVPGAPTFYTASIHAPMKSDKVALGLMYNKQEYGVTNLQNIYGVYAYQIHFGESIVSFGLQAGVDLVNSNYAGVGTTTPNDPAFTESIASATMPNIGAGVYIYNENYFFGASVPSFLSYRESGSPSALSVYHSFRNYDINMLMGGLISFSEAFRFKPSVLVRLSMARPLEVDINGNFIIADLLWLGASYRLAEESFIGIIELQLNQQIKLGYSYDYQLGSISSFSNGTHEVLLRLEFGYKVSATSPRYF
jgi:type IX secretion system PorP/SprF family membrane protein